MQSVAAGVGLLALVRFVGFALICAAKFQSPFAQETKAPLWEPSEFRKWCPLWTVMNMQLEKLDVSQRMDLRQGVAAIHRAYRGKLPFLTGLSGTDGVVILLERAVAMFEDHCQQLLFREYVDSMWCSCLLRELTHAYATHAY